MTIIGEPEIEGYHPLTRVNPLAKFGSAKFRKEPYTNEEIAEFYAGCRGVSPDDVLVRPSAAIPQFKTVYIKTGARALKMV